MTDNNENIIFEFPLNEKMRTWLRIEFLLEQITINQVISKANVLPFFHALSELLEIIERNDVRADLIKEIEIQKQRLESWMPVEGVNKTLLMSLIQQLSTQLNSITSNNRIGQELKDDKFIFSVRQRLTIPGGCCCFDLPLLYLWLTLPQSERDQQVKAWGSHFYALKESLTICLKLIRQTGEFKSYLSKINFSQNNDLQADLLRIRLPSKLRVYPQVSGHKTRFAIRFLAYSHEPALVQEAFDFELACC